MKPLWVIESRHDRKTPNGKKEEWWRFTEEPFKTKEAAEQHLELILDEYASDREEDKKGLRVTEVSPLKELIHKMAVDLQNRSHGLIHYAQGEVWIEEIIKDFMKDCFLYYDADTAPRFDYDKRPGKRAFTYLLKQLGWEWSGEWEEMLDEIQGI